MTIVKPAPLLTTPSSFCSVPPRVVRALAAAGACGGGPPASQYETQSASQPLVQRGCDFVSKGISGASHGAARHLPYTTANGRLLWKRRPWPTCRPWKPAKSPRSSGRPAVFRRYRESTVSLRSFGPPPAWYPIRAFHVSSFEWVYTMLSGRRIRSSSPCRLAHCGPLGLTAHDE